MIVDPELPEHPDYTLLKKAVGDFALESLIRLWGHCQSNRRGETWLGRGADYVEAVAKWMGNRGELFQALKQFGWVEEFEGGVKMHNWEKMNAKLISARSNGSKGGRPMKTDINNPPLTQAKPNFPNQINGFHPSESGGSTGAHPKPTENPSRTQAEPKQNPSLTLPSNPSHLSSPSLQTCLDQVQGRLDLLNRLTGASFELPIMEREEIAARLLEVSGDVAGVDQMLRRQHALWKNDARARQWLKPSTLFGTKFHDYYGQRNLAAEAFTSSGPNKKTAPTDRTELLETLSATRMALEENPDDAGLQNRVQELEAATA